MELMVNLIGSRMHYSKSIDCIGNTYSSITLFEIDNAYYESMPERDIWYVEQMH